MVKTITLWKNNHVRCIIRFYWVKQMHGELSLVEVNACKKIVISKH